MKPGWKGKAKVGVLLINKEMESKHYLHLYTTITTATTAAGIPNMTGRKIVVVESVDLWAMSTAADTSWYWSSLTVSNNGLTCWFARTAWLSTTYLIGNCCSSWRSEETAIVIVWGARKEFKAATKYAGFWRTTCAPCAAARCSADTCWCATSTGRRAAAATVPFGNNWCWV